MADLALGFTLTAAPFSVGGKPASDRIAYVFTRKKLCPVRESLLKQQRLTIYATENSVRVGDDDLATHVMFNTRAMYHDADGSDNDDESTYDADDSSLGPSDAASGDARMDASTALWCSKYRTNMSRLHADDRDRLMWLLERTRKDPFIAADIVRGGEHILSRNAHQLMRQMIFPVRAAEDAGVRKRGAQGGRAAKRRRVGRGSGGGAGPGGAGGAGGADGADGADGMQGSMRGGADDGVDDGMEMMGGDEEDDDPYPQKLIMPEHMPFQFFPAPDSMTPFFSMSVYGPTGSGKSVWIAMFLLLYTKVYSTRLIFLGFEHHDPAYDGVRDMIEFMSMPTAEEATSGAITIDRFLPGHHQQTIVIFDDSESFDAARTKVVSQVRDVLLRNGRKSNVSVICVHHRTMGGSETSASRVETTYKIFMLAGNGMRLLNQYWRRVMGYSEKETHAAIKSIKPHERFVCLHESVPTYVLTANRIMTPR